MRAVGYVRISNADRDKSEEQQRLSLRTQEASVPRYCEEHGWDLVAVHEDFDATGSNEDRPGYRDVLTAYGSENVHGVSIVGGDGNDTVIGGAYGDHLSGDAGNDRIYGGGGNDTLFGGLGNDRTFGSMKSISVSALASR